MKKILFFSLVLLGLVSCSEKPFYEKVYSFENKEWKQDQKAVFMVDIDDTSSIYQFVLTLRTTTEYDYSNVWLFWTTEDPSKQKVRQPFEVKIANEDGSWIGKNSGTIVENQVVFDDRKIPVAGKYKFVVEQGVTVKNLKDVLDLGLTIKKVKAQ